MYNYLFTHFFINQSCFIVSHLHLSDNKNTKKGGGEEKRVQFYLKSLTTGQMEMGWEIISNRQKKIEPPLNYCGKITKQ